MLVALTSVIILGAVTQLPPQLIEERTLLDFEAAPADGWRGEVVGVEGGKAGRFLVDRSDGPVAASFDYGTLGVEIDEWDELLFDYRFDRPGMAWWGIKIIDPPLGDSRQAVWQISDATKLEPAKWHTAVVDLRHPQDVWGDRASPNAHTLIFRAVLEASAQPVTVLIDNIRVRRSLLKVEKIAEGQRRTVDGVFCQSCKLLVTNHSQKPVVVTFSVAAKSTGASLARLPDKLSLGPGEEATVEPEIRVAREAATRLGRYQAEIVATEAASGAKVADVVMTVSTPLGELPHPVLLLRRDEVDEVLKAAQTAEGLKAALDGVIRSAETWLTKPLDFPNRGSQWWHWYTCKKCGSGLRTESPTRHVCPNCGAVYSGWPYDDVVLARQHGALADGARDLGLAYILTGREQYARRAAEILLGYAQRYESYPLHDINGRPTGGGRVGPQTLDEATWLIPIAQAFDAVQDRLTPEERKQIVEHLLIPAAKVTWAPRLPIHNISCWRNSAYALVGMALDDEEMVDAAVNGPGGYREQIEKGVIEPGLWYEGSWGYHFYTMSALLPFVEAAVRAGIDVLHEKYRGLYEAPVKFVAPDLRLPAFNDSGYVDLSRQAQMYQVAARHWPDSPDIAWAASLQPLRGWMALIWGARATKKPSVRFTSRVEKEAGYMVFRTNPWEGGDETLPDNYLVVDFGPHGGGHGHPDKLNIVWWAYRTLMAPDPGSIAYGNPMHGGYYRQTLAHNTVVVDGQSQKPCTGELVFFAAGENVAIGCAKANAAYPPVELTRVVAVSGQRVLDVFVAADAKPHRYELVYRNQGEMQSDLEWQPLDKEPEGAGYSWCEKWQQARADAPFTVRWNLGEGKGVVLRHIPQGNETLLTALGHDQPATTLVPFLLERVEDKVAVWVNALQAFSGEAPRLEVRVLTLPRDERGAPRAVALEADDGAHRDVLLVTLDGDELAAGPYRLRGRAALLHYGNGRLAAVLCADGSEVWANGERLK